MGCRRKKKEKTGTTSGVCLGLDEGWCHSLGRGADSVGKVSFLFLIVTVISHDLVV